MKAFKIIVKVLAVSILLAPACSGSGEAVPELTIKTTAITGNASSQYITVNAEGDWVITVSDTWLSANPSIGNGWNNAVILSWESNSTGASRSATVTVSNYDGASTSCTLTQSATSSSGSSSSSSSSSTGAGLSSVSLGWMELPETSDDDGYDFYTHDMTITTGSSSVSTRNYSFYYDYDNLVSQWVAYPLSDWNRTGSGSRTDAWAPDPLIDSDLQPTLSSGYKTGSSSLSYDRGHQLPSADRLVTDAINKTTFYYTNMTPQVSSLNQYVWANLEAAVRTWSSKCDTLYVLTGCVMDGSTDYCLDVDGKQCPIPTAYYKALLRYAPNSTFGYSGYMGLAFWFDQGAYSSSATYKQNAISISELEETLGFELFVNLPDAVGDSVAKTIKDEDPLGSTTNAESWW